MKKFLLLLTGLAFWQFGYSQQFKYEFQLESISDSGDAKHVIADIRELLGVVIVKFHDEVDEFEILTHLNWEVEEMKYDLESIGYELSDVIVKTIIE